METPHQRAARTVSKDPLPFAQLKAFVTLHVSRGTQNDCMCPLGCQTVYPHLLTCEKGDRSGLRPDPMVASDQTTMNDTPANTSAVSRSTWGFKTHRYSIQYWLCLEVATGNTTQ